MVFGQVKPSAVENEEHDGLVIAKRVTEIPSNLQMRIAYTAGGQEEYIGYAARGLAEGTDGWIIHKLTYNGSSQLTSRTIAYSNWTNRASATYA